LAHLSCVDHTWLEVAMVHGMRIAYPMVLLAASEFGHFSRHRPRNADPCDRPWAGSPRE
jgi:hypothetical protein